MAVEFVVEPFRPSDPSLGTVKTFTQWCLVDTSYFTRNGETRGWRERLIPSRTGPKDPPTVLESPCHDNKQPDDTGSVAFTFTCPLTAGVVGAPQMTS